jgi:Uncharacterized conserved protein
MTVGILLYTSSWTFFVIPRGIAGGGVTGIASIIFYATKIPVAYSYFGINLILIVIGIITMGKSFGFKTVYCILVASISLKLFPLVPWTTDIDDNLLNAIICGLVSAVGIALVFMQGGSSGGTDIIALLIAKYKGTSPGRVFLYCDLVIIGSILFLPGRGLKDVVYGYIQMASFSFTLDWILTGNKQSVQILIFSSKYHEIADMVINELNRGVTALNSVGWYSQQDSKLLVVVAHKQQLQQITQAIHRVDPVAFITVTQTASVYGRGFEDVKVTRKEQKTLKQ